MSAGAALFRDRAGGGCDPRMSGTAAFTPLPTYVLRRSITMLTPLVEQHARVLVRERQLRAESENRSSRLTTIRRWQRITTRS
jgi:hypothetical protein